jgi:hypothetical protein
MYYYVAGQLQLQKNLKFRLFILQLANPSTDSQLSLDSRAGSMNGGEFLDNLTSFSGRNVLHGAGWILRIDFVVQNLPSAPDS